jgi:hypothetical protein
MLISYDPWQWLTQLLMHKRLAYAYGYGKRGGKRWWRGTI